MVRWGQTSLTIYPKITVLSSCTKQLRQSLISSTNYQNKRLSAARISLYLVPAF